MCKCQHQQVHGQPWAYTNSRAATCQCRRRRRIAIGVGPTTLQALSKVKLHSCREATCHSLQLGVAVALEGAEMAVQQQSPLRL